MSVQMQYEPNDICVLGMSGILKRSEFGTEQTELARHIDAGSKPRLLVILENFEGWERGADTRSWRTPPHLAFWARLVFASLVPKKLVRTASDTA